MMTLIFEPIEPDDQSNKLIGSNTNDENFNNFFLKVGEEVDRLGLNLTSLQWTKLIVALRNAWEVKE